MKVKSFQLRLSGCKPPKLMLTFGNTDFSSSCQGRFVELSRVTAEPSPPLPTPFTAEYEEEKDEEEEEEEVEVVGGLG